MLLLLASLVPCCSASSLCIGGLFPYDSYDQNASAAAFADEIALINAEATLLPGVTLTAKLYDTGADATGSAIRAAEIADAGCAAVVGCYYSTNSLQVNSILAPRGVPQIAYGSTSDALTGARLFARTTRPGADLVAAMVGVLSLIHI